MIRHRVVRKAMMGDVEDEALQINELTRGAGHNWRLVCITPPWPDATGALVSQYTFEEVTT